jgi:hypothetical protein
VLEFLLKIRDLPNPDLPIALSWSELLPSPRIYATRPREMDNPDAPLTQCVYQVETPNADTLTVASMSATCPVKMDG